MQCESVLIRIYDIELNPPKEPEKKDDESDDDDEDSEEKAEREKRANQNKIPQNVDEIKDKCPGLAGDDAKYPYQFGDKCINPEHTLFMFCQETFRISSCTELKELKGIVCEHFGIENSNEFELYDDNGDMLEVVGNGPRARSVDFVIEMGAARDPKYKDFYPGPKRALMMLGNVNTFEQWY